MPFYKVVPVSTIHRPGVLFNIVLLILSASLDKPNQLGSYQEKKYTDLSI